MASTAPRKTAGDLVEAAIGLFGRHGYEGVSTRMLAESAGANVSSIRYHFGGKEALYLATLDHAVAVIRPRIEFVQSLFRRARRLAGEDPDRQAELVRDVVHAALAAFLDQPDVRRFLPLMVRELVLDGPQFRRVYEGVPRLLHETLTELVAWIDGRPAEDPAVVVRAHALLGTFLAFHLARPVLLARLRARSLDRRTRDLVGAELTDLVLASLGLPRDAHRAP